MADELRPVITFPHDAIVERAHLEAALNMSREKIEKLDLPCFSVGRDVRFIWGQVLEYLTERAKANAAPLPTHRPVRRVG